jgi:hypothetical protein
VIVFFVSRDKIIIAADSRELVEHKEPNNHACKIVALGPRLLFAESGITGINHAKEAPDNWTGSKEAARAFSLFENSKSQADVLDQLSNDWVKAMKERFARMLRLDQQLGVRQYGTENGLTRAVFVGLAKNGQIVVRELGIFFDRAVFEKSGDVKLWATNELWDITDQVQYKAMGHIKIADEFAHAASSRGLLDAQYWKSKMTETGSEEMYAAHLVEITEIYGPEEWGVGGPVDVAEMLPSKGLQWVRRKPGCPEAVVNEP